MFIQSWKNTIGKIAAVFVVLVGCTSPISTTQQLGETPSPIVVSLTSSPTTAPVITSPQDLYTPVPTITTKEVERVVDLLHSHECKLPCYLGITPGKTSLNEAKAILKSLGGSQQGDYIRKDGATEYSYSLKIGDPAAINETPAPDSLTLAINHHVSLITDRDIVQIIGISASATKSLARFREYWSRYSAAGIFLQIGRPDHLYIDTTTPDWVENGRTLLVIYEKLGVVAELYGTGHENNICPESEATFISLRLSLYNTSSPLSIYSDGRVPPTDREVWLPIEEVLGVDEVEFYDQVISDPSACFRLRK